ncbi:MAG: hypothetical protein ACOZHQ_16230 [Thermodesulfobacteriota bacterium]
MVAPPTIAVIIGLAAPAPDLAAGLDALAGQLAPGDEVILAAAGPALAAAQDQAAARRAWCRVLAGGRDQAAATARAEALLFLEPAWCPDPGLLTAVRAAFAASPAPAGLALALAAAQDASPWSALAGLEISWRQGRSGLPTDGALAFARADLAAAGGLMPAPPVGQADLLALWLALAEQGRPLLWEPEPLLRLPPRPSLRALLAGAGAWAAGVHPALRLGPAARGMAAGMALQVTLWLMALGLMWVFAPADPGRGLSLAAICLLLLYPANRDWLKWVAARQPGIVSQALAYTLLRPLAWTGGLAAGLLRRLTPAG